MSSQDALSIARRYHDAWTSGDYQKSIELLEATVKIEVPVNEYPTVESFAQALRAFGQMVTGVDLLSELGDQDEAMLLYDLRVQQIGEMRIVEHFTTARGKIVRLRQIHDTAGVRAAGLG